MEKFDKNSALENISKFVLSHEGSISAHRLNTLATLINDDGTLNYKKVLDEVFEGTDDKKKQNLLNKFRADLETKAKASDIDLKLVVDMNKKGEAKDRRLWFERGNLQKGKVLESQASVRRQPGSTIENRVKSDKREVSYFISYSHEDMTLANDFIKRFVKHTSSHITYTFLPWRDTTDLILGEKWFDQIIEGLETSDFGILLLSANFFNSGFIKAHELTHFLNKDGNNNLIINKSIAPVGLENFSMTHTDMRGLEESQIFRFDPKKNNSLKFYSEVAGANNENFMIALLDKLVLKLDKEYNSITLRRAQSGATQQTEAHAEWEEESEIHDAPNKKVIRHTQKHSASKGNPIIDNHAHLQKSFESKRSEQPSHDDKKALDLLKQWEEKDDISLFALLGQFGMGKTFTCVQYSKYLLTQYEKNKHRYIPFYFDLRDLDIRALALNFTIDDIIKSMLLARRQPGEKESLTLDEFNSIWKNEATLIIMDGIDEVLPHLRERKTETRFLEEIWKLVPNFRRRVEKEPNEPERKMVLTCRTDYFKSVIHESSFFKGGNRQHIDDKKDYKIANLLPFSKAQILNYLEQVFPDRDPNDVYKILEDIHNLEELSPRPVLLGFLVEIIDELEQKAQQNELINTATLYHTLVQKTFARDSDKHEITESIKIKVLEHLSAFLWKRKTRRISFDELEKELCEILASGTAKMKLLMENTQQENLYKDLRNATLLVRVTDNEFGFSHTSVQEYFLARYLMQMGMERKIDQMLVPHLSTETIDFLYDILLTADEEDVDHFNDGWQQLLAAPMAENNDWPFRLYLKDQGQKSQRLRKPQKMNLTGINMRKWNIEGSPDRYIDLSGIILTQADASMSTLAYINLDNATLDGSNLNSTEWQYVSLQGSSLQGASACGTWRHIAGQDLNLADADLMYLHHFKSEWPTKQFEGKPTRPPKHARLTKNDKSLGILGHTRPVNHCQFSPDGKFALSAADDNSLKLWDLQQLKLVKSFDEHTSYVKHCQFSPDGKFALSASWDNSLKLWDLQQLKLVKSFDEHTRPVNHCQFSPDGKFALSAADDNSLKLWDLQQLKLVKSFDEHTSYVKHCQFSPDGKFALSASGDNSLKLWDLQQLKLVKSFDEHTDIVNHCQFSPDGKFALSASWDNSLKLWDLQQLKLVKSFDEHTDIVNHCQFSPDGKFALSASWDNSLKLWDLQQLKLVKSFDEHTSYVKHCQFSPDGKFALSAADDNSLKLWDLQQLKLVKSFDEHTSYVKHCQFSPDGKFALSASWDNSLKLWDLQQLKLVKSFDEHTRPVNHCQFSPDGKFALSASGDNSFKLWDLQQLKLVKSFDEHTSYVKHCQFSPDGKFALSASWDNSLKLWDLQQLKLVKSFDEHTRPVNHCQFSPDGKFALSASGDNSLKLWDLQQLKLVKSFDEHTSYVKHCQFSPDGKFALSASWDNSLKLWDLQQLKLVKSFDEHTRPVNHCQFSPDGKFALSAADDNSLKLWDLQQLKLVKSFDEHTSYVNHCQFSPDGKFALSAADDNSLKLWDLQQLKLVKSFDEHTSYVNHCQFSPDGKFALSASWDNSLKLWDLQQLKLVKSFDEHTSYVNHCQFSPDGKFALSAADDGVMAHHDLSDNTRIAYYHFKNKAHAVIREGNLLEYSTGAWRHLQWARKNADGSEEDFYFDEVDMDLAPV